MNGGEGEGGRLNLKIPKIFCSFKMLWFFKYVLSMCKVFYKFGIYHTSIKNQWLQCPVWLWFEPISSMIFFFLKRPHCFYGPKYNCPAVSSEVVSPNYYLNYEIKFPNRQNDSPLWQLVRSYWPVYGKKVDWKHSMCTQCSMASLFKGDLSCWYQGSEQQ